MANDVQLHNFTGPLDLLLQLIETQEMPITEVSLSQVTEQFLEYLEEVEERSPEELADFLVVATKLLLIKSQALLPYLQLDQEEEDPNELAAQLRMYKKYAQATEVIQKRIEQRTFLYPKPQTKVLPETVFAPPTGLGTAELRQYFIEILAGLEPVVKIPKTAIQKVISLREKLGQIQQLFKKQVTMNFHELLADAQDPEEIVVTFLAVLELVKQHSVTVKQDGSFADITLQKI